MTESATEPIDFSVDLPTIVPVVSKNDLVSYSNLFFRPQDVDAARPSASTDELTQALLSGPSDGGGGGGVEGDDTAHRDLGSGAWTFKANTERDLLAHVENGLADHIRDFTDVDSARAILRSIDVYCLGKQWMFHVGQEKGEVIKPFLSKCIEAHASSRSASQFVVVELGTYCGYSAILLAMAVRQIAPDLDFHVYSTEINERHLEIASAMIRMAKLDRYVTLIKFEPEASSLADALTRRIPGEWAKIDFLFLDHAKEMYLSDLIEIEKAKLVRRGTHVVADNVVFSEKQLQKYRDYVAYLQSQSIVETSMVEGKLEYSNSLKDGLELTIYLQDPPENRAAHYLE